MKDDDGLNYRVAAENRTYYEYINWKKHPSGGASFSLLWYHGLVKY